MTAVTKDAKDALSNYKAGIEAATKSRSVRNSQFEKLKKPVGISITLLAVLWWLTWTVIPDFKAERAKEKEEASKKAAITQQAPQVAVNQQDDLGREFSLTATDVPSKDIYLPNNRCFRFWGIDPKGHAFIAEVRQVGSDSWLRWEEYKKLKSEKKLTWYPGWFRFTATGDPTPVFYQFYELRSVNCD